MISESLQTEQFTIGSGFIRKIEIERHFNLENIT